MLRRGGNRAIRRPVMTGSLQVPELTLRAISSTTIALQLQHADRLIGRTHGAGLVKHGSMALDQPQQQRIPRGVTQAAPAADLQRTEVHEGLGTSAAEPRIARSGNNSAAGCEANGTYAGGSGNAKPEVGVIAVLAR